MDNKAVSLADLGINPNNPENLQYRNPVPHYSSESELDSPVREIVVQNILRDLAETGRMAEPDLQGIPFKELYHTIPEFDGETPDVEIFIEAVKRVEQIVAANRRSQLLFLLPGKLKKRAARVVEHKISDYRNVTELLNDLRKKFSDDSELGEVEAQLRSLFQLNKETVIDFSSRVEKALKKLKNKLRTKHASEADAEILAERISDAESTAFKIFVRGLKVEIQNLVLQANPEDFFGASDAAIVCEQEWRRIDDINRRRGVVTVKEEPERKEVKFARAETSKSPEAPCTYCGYANHTEEHCHFKKAQVECTRCGRRNHWEDKCKFKPSTAQTSAGNTPSPSPRASRKNDEHRSSSDSANRKSRRDHSSDNRGSSSDRRRNDSRDRSKGAYSRDNSRDRRRDDSRGRNYRRDDSRDRRYQNRDDSRSRNYRRDDSRDRNYRRNDSRERNHRRDDSRDRRYRRDDSRGRRSSERDILETLVNAIRKIDTKPQHTASQATVDRELLIEVLNSNTASK